MSNAIDRTELKEAGRQYLLRRKVNLDPVIKAQMKAVVEAIEQGTQNFIGVPSGVDSD